MSLPIAHSPVRMPHEAEGIHYIKGMPNGMCEPNLTIVVISSDEALVDTLHGVVERLGVRYIRARAPEEAESASLVVVDLESTAASDACMDFDGEGVPLVLVLPSRPEQGRAIASCIGRRVEGFLPRSASEPEAGVVLASALRLADSAKKLREEAQRLRALAEASPDLLIVIDEDGRYLEIFTSDEKLLLAKPDRLKGRTIHEMFEPNLAEPLMNLVIRATSGQMGGMIEYQLPVLGGGMRWFEGRTAPAGVGPDGKRITVFEARDITERKENEAALRKALEEKGMLLRELQHRVKNNLAMISSLVSLESERLERDEDREAFERVQDRIRAMALVYDMLYRSEGVLDVDLSVYLRTLLEGFRDSYLGGPGGAEGPVELETELYEARLDLKRAIPLGIIVTELATNATKYAFPDGRKGRIDVRLRVGEGKAVISIEDDGIGMVQGVASRAGGGTGLKLVDLLVDQIGGRLTRSSGSSGRGLLYELELDLSSA